MLLRGRGGGRGRGEGVDDPPQCWFSVSHRLAKFQWNKEKRSKIKLKLIIMASYTLTGFRMDEFKNVNVKGYIGIYDPCRLLTGQRRT